MLRTHCVSMPIPEPFALIDATVAFTIQVLIARHPELLLPPEVTVLHPPPGLRAARHIIEAIRHLHYAIETYRDFLPDTLLPGADDDIPF
jgi:hypothetical protein